MIVAQPGHYPGIGHIVFSHGVPTFAPGMPV